VPRWRLIDDLDARRDAAGQMAADLACLDEVAAGAPPVLRLYTWSPPALSLGRFQPESDVDAARCAELGVEIVRRPTGGKALLHGADLTYAVALPRPEGAAGHVDALYRTIASGLLAGLARLGVDASVGEERGPAGPVCFAAAQGADLRVGTRKLCGSAQVQRGGVVLQHGSILLDHLPFDEVDLLAGPPPEPAVRDRIRAKRVTLRELGVAADPATVATAVVAGFEAALDVTFASRVPR
jgi:lipoate-protein ligase A